jgi:hypothetical protein
VHVPAADVKVRAGEVHVRRGQLAVVEAAEEQRRVRQVLQRLGPPVQVGLQVLEADPVAGHRVLRQRQRVVPHQVQELAGTREVGALVGDDPVLSNPVLSNLVFGSSVLGGGHG